MYRPFIEFIEVNSQKWYLYRYFPYQYFLLDKFEKSLPAKQYRPFIGFRRSLVLALTCFETVIWGLEFSSCLEEPVVKIILFILPFTFIYPSTLYLGTRKYIKGEVMIGFLPPWPTLVKYIITVLQPEDKPNKSTVEMYRQSPIFIKVSLHAFHWILSNRDF